LQNYKNITPDFIQQRAATGNDADFVNHLTRGVMQGYVESTWQHSDERERYYVLNQFHQASTNIIQCNGQDIGRISVRYTADCIILDGIHILNAYQGKGIGRYLIGQLIDHAAEQELALELILLKSNPVIKLYESLGFFVYQTDIYRFYMRMEHK